MAAPPEDFNFATLVLLPKKPSVVVDGVKWYAPKDTRPLSVTNTDNRIIANLFRLPLAEFASKTSVDVNHTLVRCTAAVTKDHGSRSLSYKWGVGTR